MTGVQTCALPISGYFTYNGAAVTGTGSAYELRKGPAQTKLYISNTGNVGIGTSSPSQTLDVAGSVSISGSQQFSTFMYNTLTRSNGDIIHDLNSSGTITLSDATGYLLFSQKPSWATSFNEGTLALKSSIGSKNVGIGFLTGTSNDALRSASNLASNGISVGNVNSMMLGYANNGPRIFISDWDMGASYSMPNTIRLVSDSTIVTGDLRIGSSPFSNYLTFNGLTNDGSGTWNHTYIGERLYSDSTEISSAFLEVGKSYRISTIGTTTNWQSAGAPTGAVAGTMFIATAQVSGNGFARGQASDLSELLLFKGNDIASGSTLDRIRLLSGSINFDTLNQITSGTFEEVGNAYSTTRMIIAAGGNVGIGTTTPKIGRAHV